MKLPSQIVVGTQTYRVEARSPKEDGMLNDGNYGYTLEAASLIVIDATISRAKQRSVLIHELLHALMMTFGSGTKPNKDAEFEDWEHHFIGIYEEALLLVLRNNPELVEYLTK